MEYVSSPSPPMDTREGSIDLTRIYILPAKIQPAELEELINLIVHSTAGDSTGLHLELTADSDQADVIVTAVHTRPRLERHITWDVAKTKAIVTPDWLKDSISSGTIQPCGKYAALRGLQDETGRVCPEVKPPRSPTPPRASPDRPGQISVPVDPEANVQETDLVALDHLSKFCCQRASPLICPNQPLVEELDIIRRERLFEGEERSSLSYARAIAVIKAYPHCFDSQTSREHIRKLPYLGMKLTSMVEEFIQTGKISEAQNILSSRFSSLSAFNSIHGIGPQTARHLYALGLRTIEDLEKYYEVSSSLTSESSLSPVLSSDSREVGVEKSIQISLSFRRDFSQKISRQESEEINRVVMEELESIEPGCKSLIAGGYRRGKPESNDVDIVISHTDWDHGADKVRGLCKKLTLRLHEHGLVKHVLSMSGYHPHNVFRTHHWDSLEKVLTVFLLPNDTARRQICRRVDLVFATPGIFWTAVVGWTGSTMFQRDLRLWAKQRGFKFDSSGITRRHDSQVFYPKSERDVFELLGLAYVHPTRRNADA